MASSFKSSYLSSASADLSLSVSKRVAFIGIFTALAILLPVVSHQFGIAGRVLLPMHFAVIIAALVMGFSGGIAVAVISPALSLVVSGMPPASAVLPMTLELVAYAAALNVFVRIYKLPVILSLIIALIAGRLVAVTLTIALTPLSMSTALFSLFVISLPGILTQLALAPLIAAKILDYLRE